jgi:ribonuclease BN (tRNA processing enzyme)
MEIIIIGSGTGVPSLRRGSPATVVKVGKHTLLLDSGSGTLRRLLEAGVDFREVDYLLYSHFHPDHTADLVPFLFASNYGSEEVRTRGLTIIGPPGMTAFYEKLKGVYGKWIIPQGYFLSVEEISSGEIPFGYFSVRGFPLAHTEHSLGFRITAEKGKVVSYSGDTDYCSNLIALARDAGVLIVECSFPDDRKVDGHLTPSMAGQAAREAGCKKVVLTHLYPPCDNHDVVGAVKREFAGEVVLAEDFMRVEL